MLPLQRHGRIVIQPSAQCADLVPACVRQNAYGGVFSGARDRALRRESGLFCDHVSHPAEHGYGSDDAPHVHFVTACEMFSPRYAAISIEQAADPVTTELGGDRRGRESQRLRRPHASYGEIGSEALAVDREARGRSSGRVVEPYGGIGLEKSLKLLQMLRIGSGETDRKPIADDTAVSGYEAEPVSRRLGIDRREHGRVQCDRLSREVVRTSGDAGPFKATSNSVSVYAALPGDSDGGFAARVSLAHLADAGGINWSRHSSFTRMSI